MEVLRIAGIGIFEVGSCDVDVHPMTWRYTAWICLHGVLD